MRRNVENKNNNPVNIRFVAKTSDIRNLSENITSDVMLNYQKYGNTRGVTRLVSARGKKQVWHPLC